ncbi:hypothetical protein N431DRAFT_459056 [Stipitochalara longipes BDJ]|nr:hypothetical protein N431DRAFT_459056 [Stipitochalara longipes BDJ]
MSPMSTEEIKPTYIVAEEQMENPDALSTNSLSITEINSSKFSGTQNSQASPHGFNRENAEESNEAKCTAYSKSEACPPLPGTISERRQSMRFETCVHVLLTILASMFLIFAFLAASVDHTVPGNSMRYKPGGPVSGIHFDPPSPSITFYLNGSYSGNIYEQEWTPVVNSLNLGLFETAKLGPTLFPILFAAIMGSFLRLVARWRAEKGLTVEKLELLIGSRSLASTVTTLFSLSTLGIIEISLIIIWALSPIAGQASVRILSSRNFTASTSTEVPWFATNITSITTIDDDKVLGIQSKYISNLVNAKDLAIEKDTGYNLPMLPMIAHNESWIRGDDLGPNEDTEPQNHTSLVGFDVIGPVFFPTPTFSNQSYITGEQIINFKYTYVNFTVNYFEFNCPSVFIESTDGSWLSILGPNSLQINSSMLLQQATSGSGFFISMNSTLDPYSSDPNIVFGSFYNSQVTLWSCLLYVSTREVTILCDDDSGHIEGNPISCEAVDRMGIASVSPITPFSNSTLASNVFGQWPLVDPASFGTSSLTEQYLARGSNFTASLVDLSKLDNQTFSARLTTIFNTYVQTRQPNTIDSDFYLSSDPGTWIKGTSHDALSFMPFVLVSCNWIWFGILTLASTFLIVCASLSIWLIHRLSTPDLMGYVSTMVLHNPHIPDTEMTSGSNSTLDGLERAKMFKRVRVQIRDVRSDGEIGQFALTSDIKNLPRTEKGRKYF